MKMQFTNPIFWGKKITIPVDGTVEIEKDGMVEVSEEAGEILNGTRDWQVLEEKEDELTDGQEDGEDDENDEDSNESDEDLEDDEEDEDEDVTLKDLLLKSKTDLQGVAGGMEFPKADWKDLKKADLAKYIFEQTQ